MSEEISLIQTHLGVWKLEDWTINQASTQLSDSYGVYCIKNKINDKLLIGEGKIGGHGSRINRHITCPCNNIKYKKDLNNFIPHLDTNGEINKRLI
jgi:hypothetical protein